MRRNPHIVLRYGSEGRWQPLSGAALTGELNRDRSSPPTALNIETVWRAIEEMIATGHERAGAIVLLAQSFGLRREEASKLDLKAAHRRLLKKGQFAVLRGAKGGRQRSFDCEDLDNQRTALEFALSVKPVGSTNLLLPSESYANWESTELRAGVRILKRHGIEGYHELRAAWACRRYHLLTGERTPCEGIKASRVDPDKLAQALLTISRELGHSRIQIVGAYVGPLS